MDTQSLLNDEVFDDLLSLSHHEPEKNQRVLSSKQAQFLSEIQISLGIEVGAIELSVSELIDILPGQTFEYEFDPQQEVNLSVSGEIVAKARFVMIDGSLGLEVTQTAEELHAEEINCVRREQETSDSPKATSMGEQGGAHPPVLDEKEKPVPS